VPVLGMVTAGDGDRYLFQVFRKTWKRYLSPSPAVTIPSTGTPSASRPLAEAAKMYNQSVVG